VWVGGGGKSDRVEVRISSRSLLFHGIRSRACYCGRCSHARAPRYFWYATNCPASLAYVLCAVRRRGLDIPGKATIIPRFHAQDGDACFPELPTVDIDGFLVDPCSFQKCVQRKSDSVACTVNAIACGETNLRTAMFVFSLGQVGVNAERFGGFTEPLVPCPQKNGRIDKHRGDQMCVG
jgi:hypothetical protein